MFAQARVQECVGRIHVWPTMCASAFQLISCVHGRSKHQQVPSCVRVLLIYGRGERYVNIHLFLRVDSGARQGSVKCSGCALINTSDKSSPLISAHHDHHSPLLPSLSSPLCTGRSLSYFLDLSKHKINFPVGHFVLQTVTYTMHRPSRHNTGIPVAQLHVKIVPVSGNSSEILHSTCIGAKNLSPVPTSPQHACM